MEQDKKDYVFGLDIGTRTIVGTVGYLEGERFIVVAQKVAEHKTRAVIDGQIHDIATVSTTIREVKESLEEETGMTLNEVSIAAAGRVLKTKRVVAQSVFAAETVVTKDHVRSLDLMGVEKAYEEIKKDSSTEGKQFYCVGFTTITYYLNGYSMSMIEMHKANNIGVELIATFLPDEVVEGLYTAVEMAGMQVVNLTLEPIAAINVAIPEKFRLLNIALVDVGAGTSDISIVKDGSIIAFGMMPLAGDEMTESIARNYLVDFQTAEKIKRDATKKKIIFIRNIMGENLKIPAEEVMEIIDKISKEIAYDVADKIIELNGGKHVSAVFIVGGGGTFESFIKAMEERMGLAENRVALRGAEVLKNVEYIPQGIHKDSTLVTPIGICLDYYKQKSNFIHVFVNEEEVKLYNNNRLTVMDAAVQAGFTRDELFPKRGDSISFKVNGSTYNLKGSLGEPTLVKIDQENGTLNDKIMNGNHISIQKATKGTTGRIQISELSEMKDLVKIHYCGNDVTCPKTVMISGEVVSPFRDVIDGDEVEVIDSCTLGQLLEYLGVEDEITLMRGEDILTNDDILTNGDSIREKIVAEAITENEDAVEQAPVEQKEKVHFKQFLEPIEAEDNNLEEEDDIPDIEKLPGDYVMVNGEEIRLEDKDKHIFVDVFDVYPFDLTQSAGRRLISKVNGQEVNFTHPIKAGDAIQLIWGD